MQVDIVTPERVLFSEKEISMVTVPGIEGQMGILDQHLPVVTFLVCFLLSLLSPHIRHYSQHRVSS